MVDRGILWKLEVALGQQKSAQACGRSNTSAAGIDLLPKKTGQVLT
jgi:hypothetical protein